MFKRATRTLLLGALPAIVAVTFAGSGLASADAAVDQQAQSGFGTAIAEFSFGTPAPVAEVISPEPEFAVSQATELSNKAPVAEAAAPVVSDVIDTQLHEVATDPKAENSDPVVNGALAGAGIGALATLVNCLPSVIVLGVGYPICLLLGVLPHAAVGAIIGGIVGHSNPEVIPQVLP
ncbi:hypothetical protein [Nocardia neocaledoniensis]|uniref:hypothetical protein n=1 Tax=Nocardia neocaledoniensis TaxID=236511 RepID=UPI002456280C|nr:hypothetical protein [Nocardia neocaledoniensis]